MNRVRIYIGFVARMRRGVCGKVRLCIVHSSGLER